MKLRLSSLHSDLKSITTISYMYKLEFKCAGMEEAEAEIAD